MSIVGSVLVGAITLAVLMYAWLHISAWIEACKYEELCNDCGHFYDTRDHTYCPNKWCDTHWNHVDLPDQTDLGEL